MSCCQMSDREKDDEDGTGATEGGSGRTQTSGGE